MPYDENSFLQGLAVGRSLKGVGVLSHGSGIIVRKNITSNGTYYAASDGADGYDPVTVSVSGGAIESWDFTSATPLVGTVRGLTLTQNDITFDSQGAVFSSTESSLYFSRSFPLTIEIDVASMNLTSGANRRFVMATLLYGIVYRSTGYWGFYSGSWEMFPESDGSLFDGSTVKIIVDNSNYWHIYKNGVLLWEPATAQTLQSTDSYGGLHIGSTNNSMNNAVISGMRLY